MSATTDRGGGEETRAAPASNQFGTFGGVFTPSILTILGVIMFMRTGFIVGQAGILAAIGILALCKLITVLTGLSISAISTNTQVEGGGAYFLISRSLGPEFGGAIGLTLYLAQAVSVPFYILGFTEALVRSWARFGQWARAGDTALAETLAPVFALGPASLEPWMMWLGLGTSTALFVLTYVGADWALRAQFFILATLIVSVLAFLGGGLGDFSAAQFQVNLEPAYVGDMSGFWVVFAIFFPAVTGIMAGVNMSGDLKNPARSIPRGTMLAIAVGGLIYLAQMLIVGGSQTRDELVHAPYESLMLHALWGMWGLVVAGVFAATLSSALGSMMGAPRILQALSRDAIFRGLHVFARGSLRGDEPRRALVLTYGITVLVVFLAGNETGGDAFNMVAEVLSMFFLYAYGMTNLAAFTESFSGNPSFRPRFRYFHWVTALLGTLGCVGVTFLISPVASLVAISTITVIFVYVRRRVLSTTFGDARRGFFYSRVRDNMLRLADTPPHPKNWRPTTLVLSGNPRTRTTLSSLALSMASGRGLVTLCEILVGSLRQRLGERREALARLESYIAEQRFAAFAEVMVAENFDTGMASVIQAHSLGPLKPNLVMMGWSADAARAVPMAQHMGLAAELEISQVHVIDRGLPTPGERGRIDLWWRGDANGSLMVILAYLLTLNWEWGRRQLRVLRRIEREEERAAARAEIERLVEAARLDAEIVVVVGESFQQVLHQHSRDASAVFLGFHVPAEGDAAAFHARFTALCEGLPTALLVSSTGEADLLA